MILGDQPAIDPRAIDRVAGARDGVSVAVRASYGGRPGHPVLLERSLFEQVGALRGDEGARGLLAGAAVRLVACDGLGSDRDIDTRGAAAAQRGRIEPSALISGSPARPERAAMTSAMIEIATSSGRRGADVEAARRVHARERRLVGAGRQQPGGAVRARCGGCRARRCSRRRCPARRGSPARRTSGRG